MPTIKVSRITKQRLELLKDKEGIKTFDGVVAWLIKEELGAPTSMFGAFKWKKWNKSEDRLQLRELQLSRESVKK